MMEHLSLNDRFSFKSQDYLLKTTDDVEAREIVLRLFCKGEVVYTTSVYCNGVLSDNDRRQLAAQHHQRHKEELAKLCHLQNHAGQSDAEASMRYLLASGFLKYGMVQEAIDNLNHLLENNQRNPLVHAKLGKAYLKVQKYSAAVEQFRQALALNDNYADVHFFYGLGEYHLRRCEPAARAFSRAIKLNPHYGEAYFFIGLALLLNVKLGQEYNLTIKLKERALQIFQRALAILPVLRGEAFDRGLKLLQEERFDEAFEAFAPSAANLTIDKPDMVNYQFHLLVLHEADKIQPERVWQEIKRLEELLQRFPNYADVAYELGFAYAVLGLSVTAQSLAHFEKALAINPDYKNALKGVKLVKNDQRGFRNMLLALLPVQRQP